MEQGCKEPRAITRKLLPCLANGRMPTEHVFAIPNAVAAQRASLSVIGRRWCEQDGPEDCPHVVCRVQLPERILHRAVADAGRAKPSLGAERVLPAPPMNRRVLPAHDATCCGLE